jgi:multidrug efflux pump subunit AcrA (membrane-fusion protein)
MENRGTTSYTIVMHILKSVKKQWKWLVGGLVVILLIWAFVANGKDDAQVTFKVTADRLYSEGITVAGNVVPHQEVDLGFESTGRVSGVYVKEGDRVAAGAVIARLDTSDLSADVDKANADLAAEIAKLEELKATEGGSAELETARQEIIQAIREAFTAADDAIRIKTDQFFTDRDTSKPTIVSYLFNDNDLRKEINAQRLTIEVLLDDWAERMDELNADSYTPEDLEDAKRDLTEIKSFLDKTARAMSQASPEGDYTQSDIDRYRSDIASARTNVDGAYSGLLSGEEALRGTVSQIPYQEAKVAASRAGVRNLQARIAKGAIIAPFSGVITINDAKVGMIASANTSLVTMMSASKFEIETFVPEVYIAGIKVGAHADVSFDAYGEEEMFPATVSFVDSASTEKDGVATYKVKLQFDTDDDRIKSGLTATVTIDSDTGPKAVSIPAVALIQQDVDTFVKIKVGEAVELRRVQVGDRDGDNVSILSGLTVGDEVILPATNTQ